MLIRIHTKKILKRTLLWKTFYLILFSYRLVRNTVLFIQTCLSVVFVLCSVCVCVCVEGTGGCGAR